MVNRIIFIYMAFLIFSCSSIKVMPEDSSSSMRKKLKKGKTAFIRSPDTDKNLINNQMIQSFQKIAKDADLNIITEDNFLREMKNLSLTYPEIFIPKNRRKIIRKLRINYLIIISLSVEKVPLNNDYQAKLKQKEVSQEFLSIQMYNLKTGYIDGVVNISKPSDINGEYYFNKRKISKEYILEKFEEYLEKIGES